MKSRKLSPLPALDEHILLEAFTAHDIKPKHAKILWRNVIQLGITDLDQINDFPKRAKELFSTGQFTICTSKVISRTDSSDGSTTKLLIELQDGRQIESVIMRYGDVELRSFPEQERIKSLGATQTLPSLSPTSVNEDAQSLNSHGSRPFRSTRRATVCVSSQVGCAMGCKFCATGTMGLLENLSAGEILEQVYHANQIERIRGVVFMGMGEPLDNYNNVRLAVNALVDTARFGLSPSRVSVSTVGLVPKIYKMIEDMPMISLALSLHAPDQELRERIVPTAKAYQIEKILQAAFDFLQHQNDEELRAERRLARHKRIPNTAAEQKENISVNGEEDAASISTKHTMVGNSAQNRRRKLMLEYVLLGPDVNCSVEVAHRLGKLLSSSESWLSNCLLNVIPYNPTTAGEPHGYRPPSQPVINEFLVTVRSYGVFCLVRQEMGQDVNAACGQLVVNNNRPKEDNGKDPADIEDIGGISSRSRKRLLAGKSKLQNAMGNSTAVAAASNDGKPRQQFWTRQLLIYRLLVAIVLLLVVRMTVKLVQRWTR